MTMQPPAPRKATTGVAKMVASAQKKAVPRLANTTVALGKLHNFLSEAAYCFEYTNGSVLDYKSAKDKKTSGAGDRSAPAAWRMIERQRAGLRIVCGIKNQPATDVNTPPMAIVGINWHPLRPSERWLHVHTSEGVESEFMFSDVSFHKRADTTVPRAWPPGFASSASFCEIPSSHWSLRVTFKPDDVDESGFCVFIRATPNRGAHSQAPTFASRTQGTHWWLHTPPDLLFTVSGVADARDGGCTFGLSQVNVIAEAWQKTIVVPRFCMPQGALISAKGNSRSATKPPRKRPSTADSDGMVIATEHEPAASHTGQVSRDIERAVEMFYVLGQPGEEDKPEASPMLVEPNEAEVIFPPLGAERRRTHDIETPSWEFVLDIIHRADLSMDLLARSLASAYCNPDHTPVYPINCWI